MTTCGPWSARRPSPPTAAGACRLNGRPCAARPRIPTCSSRPARPAIRGTTAAPPSWRTSSTASPPARAGATMASTTTATPRPSASSSPWAPASMPCAPPWTPWWSVASASVSSPCASTGPSRPKTSWPCCPTRRARWRCWTAPRNPAPWASPCSRTWPPPAPRAAASCASSEVAMVSPPRSSPPPWRRRCSPNWPPPRPAAASPSASRTTWAT